METFKTIVQIAERAAVEKQFIRSNYTQEGNRYLLFTITNFSDTPTSWGIQKRDIMLHAKPFTKKETELLRGKGWVVSGSKAYLAI
jgi:hypothetical protein